MYHIKALLPWIRNPEYYAVYSNVSVVDGCGPCAAAKTQWQDWPNCRFRYVKLVSTCRWKLSEGPSVNSWQVALLPCEVVPISVRSVCTVDVGITHVYILQCRVLFMASFYTVLFIGSSVHCSVLVWFNRLHVSPIREVRQSGCDSRIGFRISTASCIHTSQQGAFNLFIRLMHSSELSYWCRVFYGSCQIVTDLTCNAWRKSALIQLMNHENQLWSCSYLCNGWMQDLERAKKMMVR